ncbi:MAG TPA: ABC transporter ATP-binding protein [Chthoniobacterales bacterium]|nr:ABC transporter ATP-binding protein [Chthoniobacterales bacterium]
MANVALRNFTAGTLKDGVDLVIGDREFVVLTGPAGFGGSAIVRAIAGLEDVSGGEILFDRPINRVAAKDRDVALVSHDYTPYPALSVFENLAIGLRRRNFGESETKKRIVAVAAVLGLEEELEQKADSLPGGRQRLVGLARAMVRQPKVYLFDEPFRDLDSAAARRARTEIVNLQQRSSATIIYATSAAAEAIALDQRTVVFSSGAIQQDGPARAIYDEPENLAVASFFGNPPMNLVAGTLRQERSGVVFSESGDGTMTLPLPLVRFPEAASLAGKSVFLGLRPEDIEIEGPVATGTPVVASFRALVERAEPSGAEATVYLNTGAHSLIARSRRWGQEAGGGRRLQFRATLEKAHLFDAETGGRVTPSA